MPKLSESEFIITGTTTYCILRVPFQSKLDTVHYNPKYEYVRVSTKMPKYSTLYAIRRKLSTGMNIYSTDNHSKYHSKYSAHQRSTSSTGTSDSSTGWDVLMCSAKIVCVPSTSLSDMYFRM
jgi:hypothetical protein